MIDDVRQPQAPRLQVAHTADLDPDVLGDVRALLDAVFVDDPLDEHDWDHALGGMHVLLWDGSDLVGHAAVVRRYVVHGGRALRTGYVEAVGVHPARRRLGLGGILMDEVGRLVRGGYDLGALGATTEAIPLYAGRGWQPWQGPTWSHSPSGTVRTADADDSLFVLVVAGDVDPTGDVTCDWRDGSVW